MKAEALLNQVCWTLDGKQVEVETIYTWVDGLPRKAIGRFLQPSEGSGYMTCFVDMLKPLDPTLQNQKFV